MKVGVGFCDLPDSASAGAAAAREAAQEAGREDPCDFVWLFCTARHNQQALRGAVAEVVGGGVPIYGGGAAGIITNRTFGYAGDQVGVCCVWLEDSSCRVLMEPGLAQSEQQTGRRLGERLAQSGVTPDSPLMLFYDAVDRTGEEMRLLMATWLLQGLEQGLGFLPDITGAGIQGDHVCSPTGQFLGEGIGAHHAMAMVFSEDIRIDSTILHGCRPASPYYTVTRAEGPVILEINDTPAIPFIDALLGPAITPEQYPFFLLFGINHGEPWGEYDESRVASRLCLGIDRERQGIVMFEPDMVAGTRFQLMYRALDLDYMKPKIAGLFDRLEGREPLFAMYIDCAGRSAGYAGVEAEDALVVQQIVGGRVPLLGLYTGVEIAPIGGRPRGLDWTGVFCLFSKAKAGEKAPPPTPALRWESQPAQADAYEATTADLQKLCQQNVAKILALDTQSVSIRHELEQKRRGFGLLSELSITLRDAGHYEEIFDSVAQRINAALNMQKTAVLVPDGQGLFLPSVLQGFSGEEVRALLGRPIAIDPSMLRPGSPALVNGADEPDRYAGLREALGLPFLIAAPVMVQQEAAALLITGRLAEQAPFLSRLSPGDAETVQAICALMASVLVRAQLDEAEARAHVMLDSTPLCANFWNQQLQNIDCNEAAVKLFDLGSKQEYLDRFFDLSPEYQPDGRRSTEVAPEMIRRAFAEGYCQFEWMHQKLSGEPMPSEIILVRVTYQKSDVVIGYTRDLRELKATLSQMERTQAQLREARDRAEQSARAKSNFLANMSHEIRTPMNAIIGMTEIAKGSDDPERIAYCLGKIDEAGNHLLGVINDILDMSKIDAGKFSLSLSDFALEDMLQQVANVINFKIAEKGQEFLIKIDRDVPGAIVSDKQRLVQVITNLLANAVKFTPEEGKISLLIHLKAQTEDQCTLHFEVVDTGIGIEKAQQKQLFQTFTQADDSISRRFGGTGLGLAISKDIVSMMGGRIWVESEPGAGSCFAFTIQTQKGHAKPYKRPQLSPQWQGVRILVVDDEPAVREYFGDMAEHMGILCVCAADAEQALSILEQDPGFQVIYVDWRLPSMDGMELTRRIKGRAGRQPVVVMISAAAGAQVEAEAQAAGADHFIAKPLLPSPIIDSLNQCLGAAPVCQAEQCDGPDPNAGIFAGKHILLAEDIEINREVLTTLLEETGAVFHSAENGRIACQRFEEDPERYDMILMDIHMPEMDGYQATRTIRAMDFDKARRIPILAMTANVFREDVESCLAAGMNDHVGKPIDIDEVMSKLKAHLL